MVRKTFLWAIAAVLAVAAAQAQTTEAPALTVDEVIAGNLEARGGKDKIAAVRSVRFTGRMTMGEAMDGPAVLVWKRPNMVRMEFTIEGLTGVQAFDGKSGWSVMPFLGKDDPEPMTADELKDVPDMGDVFEGPLFDHAAKGHQVELLGQEDVEGTAAYKLRLTKKNGDVVTMFLNAATFLEIKTEGRVTRRGQVLEFESSAGDYKAVGGILFPHRMEQKPKGAPSGSTITLDKIELNVDLPNSQFAMPELKPKPAN